MLLLSKTYRELPNIWRTLSPGIIDLLDVAYKKTLKNGESETEKKHTYRERTVVSADDHFTMCFIDSQAVHRSATVHALVSGPEVQG